MNSEHSVDVDAVIRENAELRKQLEREIRVRCRLDTELEISSRDNAKLEAENAELKRLQSKTVCAYCGFEVEIDDEASSIIGEHIKTCLKHPIRVYARHCEALEEQNAELTRNLRQETARLAHADDELIKLREKLYPRKKNQVM